MSYLTLCTNDNRFTIIGFRDLRNMSTMTIRTFQLFILILQLFCKTVIFFFRNIIFSK